MREKKILNILENVVKDKVWPAHYCIGGYQDSSICILKKDNRWIVCEHERSNDDNVSAYDNLEEAAIDFLGRVGNGKEGDEFQHEFLKKLRF